MDGNKALLVGAIVIGVAALALALWVMSDTKSGLFKEKSA